MKYLYLWLDAGSLLVPFLFSFHPKIQFYKRWKYAFPAIGVTAIIFLVWDVYFTQIGVWGFNYRYLSGIHMYNLPIEEVLFFICIPYSCLFTYYCFSTLIKRPLLVKSEKWITGFLLIFLIGVSIINDDKKYTVATFASLAGLLLFLRFGAKVTWLPRFYFSYIVLLIPFCIVNGILTGTGLEAPVVWYNNHQNLAFRLGTIPFEDVFYGMFLILLAVSFYEYFSRRRA